MHMKNYIHLIFFLLTIELVAQEPIVVGLSGIIGFENNTDSIYILSDTSKVWQIGQPQKEHLYLPNDLPFLYKNAVFTDTSQYYLSNSLSWIQFRLIFNIHDFYQFEFFQAYDFEKNKDGGIIETSWDNGKTWSNLIFDERIFNESFDGPLYGPNDTIASLNNQPGYTGFKADGVFKQLFEWENDTLDGDTLLLRFTFSSDSNNANNEGWLLDNFRFIGGLVFVDDIFLSQDVELYPNPAVDIIQIKGNTDRFTTGYIVDINGRKVQQCRDISFGTVHISAFPPGVYFLILETSSGIINSFKFHKL